MMEEIFMSQLITSTSCYSGARDANTLRFASETHSLKLNISNNSSEAQANHIPALTWEPLSEINSNESLICVGHSSTSTFNGGECQAVCLLSGTEQQPQQTSSSVVEHSTSASTTQQQQHIQDSHHHHHHHHQRRLTHDGTITSATTLFQNMPDTTNNSGFQRSSWAHHHPQQNLAPIAHTTSYLCLTVEIQPFPQSADNSSLLSNENNTGLLSERYTSQPLSFRPLAPCVCQLWVTNTTGRNDATSHDNDGEEDNINNSFYITGVWVGSSDDNLLRLFLHDESSILEEKSLNHSCLLFQSPVMALDFLENVQDDLKRNRLAVACQDGTIRLLEFQCHGTKDLWNFAFVEEYTVIVDGPIVCLHWNRQHKKQDTFQVVAGSLCGYVCSLQKSNGQSTWQGPTMVAQGFWDQRLQTEDSVLAVHCHQNYVTFGTYSGKVWVYVYRPSSDDYQVAWNCQMFYPIHGVCYLQISRSSKSELVVTTRRTVHILQHKRASVPLARPRYAAELAKQRLECLLTERKSQSCSTTDFVTLDHTDVQDDEKSDVWILL